MDSARSLREGARPRQTQSPERFVRHPQGKSSHGFGKTFGDHGSEGNFGWRLLAFKDHLQTGPVAHRPAWLSLTGAGQGAAQGRGHQGRLTFAAKLSKKP